MRIDLKGLATYREPLSDFAARQNVVFGSILMALMFPIGELAEAKILVPDRAIAVQFETRDHSIAIVDPKARKTETTRSTGGTPNFGLRALIKTSR